MAISINTNIASMNAQRNLGKSSTLAQASLQRLSSGLRINSARDDAAGLAISNRFNTQIRALNVAIRNGNDAVSYAQTTESALEEISVSLQRIRDLALQSSNAANSADDRRSLQAEVNQLVEEINRIAETTTFNGKRVANGSVRDMKFHVGTGADETVKLVGIDARASALGSQPGQVRSIWQGIGKAALSGDAMNLGSFSIQVAGSDVIDVLARSYGGSIDTIPAVDLTSSEHPMYGRGLAKDLAARVNGLRDQGLEALRSVYATAKTQVTGLDFGDGAPTSLSLGAQGNLINPVFVDGKWYAFWDRNGDGTANVGDRLSHDTLDGIFTSNSTFTATNPTADTDATFRYARINGFQLALPLGGTSSAGGSMFGTSIDNAPAGEENPTYDDLLAIWDGFNGTGTTQIINGTPAGWVSGMYWSAQGNPVFGTPSQNPVLGGHGVANISNGTYGYTGNGTAQHYIAIEIVAPPWTMGSDAPVQAGMLANGDININGVDLSPTRVQAADQDGRLADAINAKASLTGVTASVDSQGRITLEAADGRDIVLNTTANGSKILWNGSSAMTDQRKTGDLTLSANRSINLAGGGAAGNQADISNAQATGTVQSIDISTVDACQTAIRSVDSALSQVDTYRAAQGAVQNRMESTIRNLAAVSGSLAAASSRIKDADFAVETAILSRAQVLQQAGNAIVAQANQLPRQALALIEG